MENNAAMLQRPEALRPIVNKCLGQDVNTTEMIKALMSHTRIFVLVRECGECYATIAGWTRESVERTARENDIGAYKIEEVMLEPLDLIQCLQ